MAETESKGFVLPKGDPRAWMAGRLYPLDRTPVAPKRSGDINLNPQWKAIPQDSLRPAAVLVPLIEREAGLSVLLTVRASHLNNHAGQVSFPGGRIEDGESALDAALRETYEEIGVAHHHVAPVGQLDTYDTGTGFRIFPIVGILKTCPDFIISPQEVEEVFEVPLDYALNHNNRQIESKMWQGTLRHFYTMTYANRTIWGATMGILVNLRVQLS